MIRRIGIVVAATLALFVTTPAMAATVVAKYSCGGIWTPLTHRSAEVTVTAPATAAPGQTVTVTVVRLVDLSRRLDQPVAAGSYRYYLRLTLGGAASGMVNSTVMTNPALAAGEHVRVENGTAQVTMPASGDVTYQPTRFGPPENHWYCWPKDGEPVPVVATTSVR